MTIAWWLWRLPGRCGRRRRGGDGSLRGNGTGWRESEHSGCGGGHRRKLGAVSRVESENLYSRRRSDEVGVLRLRRAIRLANHSAPLRMTRELRFAKDAYYCGPTRKEDARRGAGALDALRRRALLRGEVSE